MSVVHYNVYIAPDAMGPWTLVNDTPIVDNVTGNEYTIPNLINGNLYYIMVVGGRLDEVTGEFLPSCGQPLKPVQDIGSETLNPNITLARPIRI